jgi:hypothetical protein
MKCPDCGSKLVQVYDTKLYEELNCKRRRRICSDCQNRFTTVELLGKVREENETGVEIEIGIQPGIELQPSGQGSEAVG